MNHYRHPTTGSIIGIDEFEPAKETKSLAPDKDDKEGKPVMREVVMPAKKSHAKMKHDQAIAEGYVLMTPSEFESLTAQRLAERDRAIDLDAERRLAAEQFMVKMGASEAALAYFGLSKPAQKGPSPQPPPPSPASDAGKENKNNGKAQK